jgi:hypothetical protein
MGRRSPNACYLVRPVVREAVEHRGYPTERPGVDGLDLVLQRPGRVADQGHLAVTNATTTLELP